MKISVVTVCRNSAEYLCEAMQSVQNQTWAQLEYLLIDGASSDGSVALISSRSATDERVQWISEPDLGISDAMNKGLARASGDVIAFLHADDSFCRPDVLAVVAGRMAASPDSFWLTGGLREINSAGALLRELPVRRYSRRRLLRNNIIYHPATFVRREAFELLGGFDPALRYAMDYDFWLRLARLGPPLLVKEPLANFRIHRGSISTSNRRAVLEEEYLVRQRFVRNPLSQIGHALYHRWRLRRLSLQRGVLG